MVVFESESKKNNEIRQISPPFDVKIIKGPKENYCDVNVDNLYSNPVCSLIFHQLFNHPKAWNFCWTRLQSRSNTGIDESQIKKIFGKMQEMPGSYLSKVDPLPHSETDRFGHHSDQLVTSIQAYFKAQSN